MSRRRSRIAAVEVLYAADVRGVPVAQVLTERDEDPPPPYGAHLALAWEGRRDEVDDLLRAVSTRWPPERMSTVDRNVLRAGVVELLEEEVPPAVAIDEAIEVAKLLSGEDSGGFVNGVLEGIRVRLQSSPSGSGGT